MNCTRRLNKSIIIAKLLFFFYIKNKTLIIIMIKVTFYTNVYNRIIEKQVNWLLEVLVVREGVQELENCLVHKLVLHLQTCVWCILRNSEHKWAPILAIELTCVWNTSEPLPILAIELTCVCAFWEIVNTSEPLYYWAYVRVCILRNSEHKWLSLPS